VCVCVCVCVDVCGGVCGGVFNPHGIWSRLSKPLKI
jgi:hypothetical protein